MEEIKDEPFMVGPLTGEYNEKKKEFKSLRFTLPAAIIKARNIKQNDSVFYKILGYFEGEDQKVPSLFQIEGGIPVYGTVKKAGSTSLGITVDKKQAVRFGLKKGMNLLIVLKTFKKGV